MCVLNVCDGTRVLNVLVCVTWCPPESAATALTVSVWDTGSVQSLCQAVRELLKVPVSTRSPVSPAPLTVTDLSVPLDAVTVIPLTGSAPVVPLAGVKLSCTVSGDCECLRGVPPAPLLDDGWQAAASTPAAQITTKGASAGRFDRLSSCSTPTSHGPGFPAMPTPDQPRPLPQYARGADVLDPCVPAG